jgi:hypothetical protein
MLASGAYSPSGVLAAVVPAGTEKVTSVATASTWPWEFDAYQWLRRTPAHGHSDEADVDTQFGGAAPEFDEYLPTVSEPFSLTPITGINRRVPTAGDIARAIAGRSQLPVSTRLYVIILP